jgi:hypothetical protein
VVLECIAEEGHRTGKEKVLNTIGRVAGRVVGQLWPRARWMRKRLGEPSSGVNTSIALWREWLRIVLQRHYRSWVYQRHSHAVADGKGPGVQLTMWAVDDGTIYDETIDGLER